MVFPVLQPMRVSEEQVCTDLLLQKLVFTSLHLRFTVHVGPPLGAAALLFYDRLLPRPLCQILAPTWRTASEKWEALTKIPRHLDWHDLQPGLAGCNMLDGGKTGKK